MAYNITATDTSTNNRLLENVGSYCGIAAGVGLASTTTLTVTIPSLKTIQGVVLTPQTAAATATLTSTEGNVFTATTSTSGDTVHWLAWGIPNA